MAVETFVADTSIFVRWFLEQEGWELAREYRRRYLADDVALETVECARFELPHVLRTKGLITGKMTEDEYLAAVRIIDDLDIPVEPMTADGIEACAAVAVRHNLRFYDAVFLRRAAELGVALLTADQPLANVAERIGVPVVRVVNPPR